MLDESLTSVFAQTHEPIEVILVDNGSTDDAATRARDTYGDRLHYIRNEDNLGFAGRPTRSRRCRESPIRTQTSECSPVES